MKDEFITVEDYRNLRRGIRWGLLLVAPFWLLLLWAVYR